MKDPQLISSWLKQVKINSPEHPVDSASQKKIEQYWAEHAGICTQYTQVLLFNSGRLVVFCDSSVWINQLRHQVPSLILQLNEAKFNINKITLKLKPSGNI